MGLLEILFPKKEAPTTGYFKTLTAYSPVFTSWNGSLYESELVRSAIDARARHVSKLKIEVSGPAKPMLQARMRLRPNSFMTWGQFLYRLSTILDMENTAFIVPVLDPSGTDIQGFFPVLPQSCEIVQTAAGIPWLRYMFSNGEKAAVEFSKCGIMRKHQYKDDIFGERNFALDRTMDLINIRDQGIKEAIKASASYRFMAQVNNFTKPDDLAKERKRFTAENLSKDAGGGLLLFPNTYANIQQINNTPYSVDAEQMKLIQTNVYNYFGVNEKILQNAAIGDEWAAFYEGAIEPFAIQLSDVMTEMAFTDRERAQGTYIMATANRLQYLSNKDKLEVSAQMADRGIMTVNEIREIWNLPPIAEGDVRLARGEYYQVEGGQDNAETDE